ncbi:hypothetical protein [Flavobacterium anhuiense]|uniref:hypothetical protein n=1 Tax=Flavobacterium anhuiense TaxID=459526 RepID=UPI0020266448|nr:hypothetical protein [Flavobacterium anhuiense]URM36532.1 hypothetical protein LLY39_19275 [Flavobacterium anhuiense]
MITNNFSIEMETKLNDFFTDKIDCKEMAKMIREVNNVLSLSVMRKCETIKSGIKNVDDNFYWLNQLAEVLDPYLEA